MSAERWHPVPVYDQAWNWGLRCLLGQDPFVPTGEYKCTPERIDRYRFGDLNVQTCRTYHRSRATAEKHCRKLNKQEQPNDTH